MSSTFCNHVSKGMSVSHQGISLCCVNDDKHQKTLPSEFWKSDVRKDATNKMNRGEKIKGCDRCYKTESMKMPSNRTFATKFSSLPEKTLPTMLDLDLSNLCNLKCVMCNAIRSSEWAKDNGKSTSSVSYKIIDDIVSISGDLQNLTIQGGEPTIMHEYEYYFQQLDEKGLLKNIDLQIITNVTNINNKFYSLLEGFKTIQLSLSIDSYGTANNYIRWPSKFSQIEKNIKKISELSKNVQVDVLNSVNILSMFNYYDFLSWCSDMENLFDAQKRTFRVVPMKVERPECYSPFIAPINLKRKFIDDCKKFISKSGLRHNTNWKTETLILLKQIESSQTDIGALNTLKENVLGLDRQRNTKITNYIPDFYEYI